MTKTYLVSEELLRQVLDAVEESRGDRPDLHCVHLLRTMIAKEPNDPVGWYCCYPGQFPFLITEASDMQDHIGYTEPIYRKDTP